MHVLQSFGGAPVAAVAAAPSAVDLPPARDGSKIDGIVGCECFPNATMCAHFLRTPNRKDDARRPAQQRKLILVCWENPIQNTRLYFGVCLPLQQTKTRARLAEGGQ